MRLENTSPKCSTTEVYDSDARAGAVSGWEIHSADSKDHCGIGSARGLIGPVAMSGGNRRQLIQCVLHFPFTRTPLPAKTAQVFGCRASSNPIRPGKTYKIGHLEAAYFIYSHSIKPQSRVQTTHFPINRRGWLHNFSFTNGHEAKKRAENAEMTTQSDAPPQLRSHPNQHVEMHKKHPLNFNGARTKKQSCCRRFGGIRSLFRLVHRTAYSGEYCTNTFQLKLPATRISPQLIKQSQTASVEVSAIKRALRDFRTAAHCLQSHLFITVCGDGMNEIRAMNGSSA